MGSSASIVGSTGHSRTICHACTIEFSSETRNDAQELVCPRCDRSEFIENLGHEAIETAPIPLFGASSLQSHNGYMSATALMLQFLEHQMREELLDSALQDLRSRVAHLDDAPKALPVPMVVIDSFPEVQLKASDIEDGAMCCICDEKYCEGATMVSLPQCHHMFHRPCLTRWFRFKNTCPICRHAFPEVPSLSSLEALTEEELRGRLRSWDASYEECDSKAVLAKRLWKHLAPPPCTPRGGGGETMHDEGDAREGGGGSSSAREERDRGNQAAASASASEREQHEDDDGDDAREGVLRRIDASINDRSNRSRGGFHGGARGDEALVLFATTESMENGTSPYNEMRMFEEAHGLRPLQREATEPWLGNEATE